MITIRAQLEAIRPNSDRLLASDTSGRVAGVILTLRCVVINNHQLRYLCNVSLCSRARAEDKEDFFSRYFAPWNGIPEVRANTIFVKWSIGLDDDDDDFSPLQQKASLLNLF